MSKIKKNPPVPSLVGAGDGKRKRKQKKHLENRPTKKVKINLAKRQGKCKSANKASYGRGRANKCSNSRLDEVRYKKNQRADENPEEEPQIRNTKRHGQNSNTRRKEKSDKNVKVSSNYPGQNRLTKRIKKDKDVKMCLGRRKRKSENKNPKPKRSEQEKPNKKLIIIKIQKL